MFTGIVQAQCPLVAAEDKGGIRQLTVDLGEVAQGLELGASVANNGACLTASFIDDTNVRFDVISETLEMTNLGSIQVGETVNIERSLRFGDELGGHIVSGHVSGTAAVQLIETDRENRTIWFDLNANDARYLLWKGWVALDGVSLTVSRVDRARDRFAVSLIPETLTRTGLGRVDVGDRVNVEIDAQTQAIVQTVRDVLSDSDLLHEILRSSRERS